MEQFKGYTIAILGGITISTVVIFSAYGVLYIFVDAIRAIIH